MTTTSGIQQVGVIGADRLSMPAAASGAATAFSGKPQRIPALDFTKGALVLIMVLYHWLNYFYANQSGLDVYRYLRFLTPSFIFITGFLVSNVYFSKYGVTNPRLPRRLIERGLKILAVFVALNLVRTLMVPRAAREQLIAEHLSARSLTNLYIIGTDLGGGQGKAVAFYVLVPIGYLLVLSAMLLIGARVWRRFFHLTLAVCFLALLALDLRGLSSANLQLITIGLLGVILGYTPIDKISKFVNRPLWVIAAYLCYLAAITIWNVIYPLQIVGVCVSLMTIYMLGDAGRGRGWIRKEIILLGQYSLVGYIAQIAILQLLHQALRHTPLISPGIQITSFIAAVVLTVMVVEATHRARRRIGAADRIYRAVFA